MSTPTGAGIEDGRAALRRGDGDTAREIFASLAADDPSAEALEGLARAVYLQLDFRGGVAAWERAYAAYRDRGDGVGAVRVARTLAYVNGAVLGDAAVMAGWIGRATTLLSGVEDCSERGWVELDLGMFTADRPAKERHLRAALDAARRFGDTDLEFVALAYLGASLVHGDRIDDGMRLLDEALAAIAGTEIDDFIAVGEIFCQLFAACEYANDVVRADQWIRLGDEIAARRSLPEVSAFCRTHYGGLLTAAGRWPEADVALTEAIRLWGLGYRSLRVGALARLADLRVRQGRLEEAALLLDGLDVHLDAAKPLAALHLARGEPAIAADVLDRALGELDPLSSAAGPLLGLLVEVHLAAGDVEDAAAAARKLDASATVQGTLPLQATAALARGRLAAATGGQAAPALGDAVAGFARLCMPMEEAVARLELARALAGARPEIARRHARAALRGFEALDARRRGDEAAAMLRSLGDSGRSAPRSRGPLTRREAEILDLLAHGMSNPQIAERLFISRKTVEHHVASVLGKLGLASRAEAAAYANAGKISEQRQPAVTARKDQPVKISR